MNLEHGGNLVAAEARFGIPAGRWIDISTGISPWSWPVPPLPEPVVRDLPYSNGGLEAAAAQCYGTQEEAVLAVPGSQYALQTLPTLLPQGAVAIPAIGYAEHRRAWQACGHSLVEYTAVGELEQYVESGVVDYAVLINPNNPSAEVLARARVEALHETLASKGGLLLVDEAFVDPFPALSCAPSCPRDGLVVLRSLGKFYGLAGLRLGFFLGPLALREKLAATMSPWLVNHPARWIGEQALLDRAWQQMQSERLLHCSQQWHQELSAALPQIEWLQNALFMTALTTVEHADALHTGLAQRGVLIRKFDALMDKAQLQPLLRFGLPHSDHRERVLSQLNAVCEDLA